MQEVVIVGSVKDACGLRVLDGKRVATADREHSLTDGVMIVVVREIGVCGRGSGERKTRFVILLEHTGENHP